MSNYIGGGVANLGDIKLEVGLWDITTEYDNGISTAAGAGQATTPMDVGNELPAYMAEAKFLKEVFTVFAINTSGYCTANSVAGAVPDVSAVFAKKDVSRTAVNTKAYSGNSPVGAPTRATSRFAIAATAYNKRVAVLFIGR